MWFPVHKIFRARCPLFYKFLATPLASVSARVTRLRGQCTLVCPRSLNPFYPFLSLMYVKMASRTRLSSSLVPRPLRAPARKEGLVYIDAFLGPNTFVSLKSGSPIRLQDLQSTYTCILCRSLVSFRNLGYIRPEFMSYLAPTIQLPGSRFVLR